MHIEFDYIAAEDCCYVRVSGSVSTAEVRQSFDQAWATPDYTDAGRAFWDYSQAQLQFSEQEAAGLRKAAEAAKSAARAKAGSDAARGLAAYAHQGRPEKLPGRVALIAGSDLDLGMMRIYLGFTAFDDFEAQAFGSEASARAWLFAPG